MLIWPRVEILPLRLSSANFDGHTSLERWKNERGGLKTANPKYPGSVLRVRILDKKRGIAVVMDKAVNGCRDIITAYPCRPEYIRFLILKAKKLHATAAGETPSL